MRVEHLVEEKNIIFVENIKISTVELQEKIIAQIFRFCLHILISIVNQNLYGIGIEILVTVAIVDGFVDEYSMWRRVKWRHIK